VGEGRLAGSDSVGHTSAVRAGEPGLAIGILPAEFAEWLTALSQPRTAATRAGCCRFWARLLFAQGGHTAASWPCAAALGAGFLGPRQDLGHC
jgi:hypothetical protein